MAGPPRSNVPFVLTAGFALGLGLGWLMFHSETVSAPPARPADGPRPEARATLRRDAGTLKDVEQIFERWGGYAVWENDVTEIALWSVQDQRHDDYYEVRRVGGEFYFRSLARLTRPLIDHGVRSRSLIAFTETQALHDYFYRENPGYRPGSEPPVDLPPSPPQHYERKDLSVNGASALVTPGAGP